MTAVLVAVLGAAGALGRWLLANLMQKLGRGFPAGTLTVNVLGSLAIGLVMTIYAARSALDARARIGLTAGLLGGFTTYSSFAYETWVLLEKRSYVTAMANVLLTVALCLGACVGGVALGRLLAR